VSNLLWRVFQIAVIVVVMWVLHQSQTDIGEPPRPGLAFFMGIGVAYLATELVGRLLDLPGRLAFQLSRLKKRLRKSRPLSVSPDPSVSKKLVRK
jgi:hypothetical protein